MDVIIDAGTEWGRYSREQKNMVGASAQLAKAIKIILDTPLLDDKGELTRDSGNVVTEWNEVLAQLQ